MSPSLCASTTTSTKLREFPSLSDGNARKNRRAAH